MDKETKDLIEFYDNKIKDLENQNKEKQDKLDKIKELVNKYGYYTLSEIPELLSIIDGKKE